MRVPKAFRNEKDAEIEVRFKDPVLGEIAAARKIDDLPREMSWSRIQRNRARSLAKARDYAGAVKVYGQAAERYPENPWMLADFAWFLVTVEDRAFRDAKRAIPLARKGVELTGEKEGYILDTLAVALYEDGQIEEAVKYAQMAARLEPNHKEVCERARKYAEELKARKK